jgi:hypothetical protein
MARDYARSSEAAGTKSFAAAARVLRAAAAMSGNRFF